MFKPIDIDDLVELINDTKLKKFTEFNRRYKMARALMNSEFETIPINHNNGLLMLPVDEIIYVQNSKKTCLIQSKTQKFESEKSFIIFEEILIPKEFVEFHHSYLINPGFISKIYTKPDRIELITGQILK